ncbi:hypothetical protein [Aliikangiella sp. G2MR2-5]|uniref:hypothetical protein n=1 Tax=Aliikangiella sp. G2MR2-5 TaxID=2788943 RepID=UPI0018A98248|nr:hypothetical protein [Aliikangiella sp. G2MR2-5]
MNPTDNESWPEFGRYFVGFVHKYQWYFFLLIITLVVLGFFIKKLAGDEWAWNRLQFLIDAYQEKVFKKFSDDPRHFHRVTLFQYQKFRWRLGTRPGRFENKLFHKIWPYKKESHPLSGWLVPVLRSGHTTQKASSVFLCNKDHAVAEGIAGMIFIRSGTTVTQPLPVPSQSAGKKEIKKYCTESSITIDRYYQMFRNGQPPPATIGGFPIEKNGKLWGVLVLDSTSETGVDTSSIDDYSILISLIGQILERT